MALTGGNGGGTGASGGGPGGNGGKSSKSTGNNGFKMTNPLTKAEATKSVNSQIKAAEAKGYTGFKPVTNNDTITATGTRTTPGKVTGTYKNLMSAENWKKYLANETPEERAKRHAREVKHGKRNAPKTETLDISEKYSDQQKAQDNDGSSAIDTKPTPTETKTELEKTKETIQPPADGKNGELASVMGKSTKAPTVDGDKDTGGGVGIQGQTAASLQKDNLQLNNQAVNQMA